jgi:hypothetical protein
MLNKKIMNELQDFNYVKCLYENDNLPDVFGTVLNTFPDITGATVTGQIYLWELLQKIKYNFAEDIDVEHLLTDKYIDGAKNPVYEEKKKKLPAVCYNAVFNGYKNIENVRHVTNLMFLDIDDFGSYDEVTEYKNHITQKYDWIVACNLSLSRLGLHVIILVDNITGNNDFNSKYDFISTTYFDKMLDPVSKSLSRYAVIPADYNIYINENPKVLEIDKILNQEEKGIRSVYNTNAIDNEKGICSVYNTESEYLKGICSAYNTNDEGIEEGIRSAYKKREEIYTPYTLCSNSSLNQMMNDSAREQNLIFRQSIAESSFKNPDIPLYFPEGMDVMEMNLFALKYRKLIESRGTSAKRLSFLGSITVKMIYLNAVTPLKPIKEVRRAILKFVVSINKKYCEPPVSHREVLNSFNANWKKFKAGELDFSNYYTKKKAFWSQRSSLSSNEKRKITCTLKNEPVVIESKRKILEAIAILNNKGEKITQKKVGSMPGLTFSLVKKYRKFFKECKEAILATSEAESKVNAHEVTTSQKDLEIVDVDAEGDFKGVHNTTESKSDVEDVSHFDTMNFGDDDDTLIIENYVPRKLTDSIPEYSDKQIQTIFDRIYNSVKSKITPAQNEELFKSFCCTFNELSIEEKKLMSMGIDDFKDFGMYSRQGNLDIEFLTLCSEMLQSNSSK